MQQPSIQQVLIIDDHQLLPTLWMKHLHNSSNPVRNTTREPEAVRQLIQATQPYAWGIITLKDMSECHLLKPLRRWLPQAILVAITATDDLHSNAYAAGIEYVTTINQLNWPELDQQIHQTLRQRAQQHLTRPKPRKIQPLNAQQRQILHYVAHGMSNKEISRATYLAEGTVKNHLIRIFDYLGVTNRTQAALKAAPFA
ncbi:MAG: response regulator transcription factor [Pseudomonadota bacterium]